MENKDNTEKTNNDISINSTERVKLTDSRSFLHNDVKTKGNNEKLEKCNDPLQGDSKSHKQKVNTPLPQAKKRSLEEYEINFNQVRHLRNEDQNLQNFISKMGAQICKQSQEIGLISEELSSIVRQKSSEDNQFPGNNNLQHSNFKRGGSGDLNPSSKLEKYSASTMNECCNRDAYQDKSHAPIINFKELLKELPTMQNHLKSIKPISLFTMKNSQKANRKRAQCKLTSDNQLEPPSTGRYNNILLIVNSEKWNKCVTKLFKEKLTKNQTSIELAQNKGIIPFGSLILPFSSNSINESKDTQLQGSLKEKDSSQNLTPPKNDFAHALQNSQELTHPNQSDDSERSLKNFKCVHDSLGDDEEEEENERIFNLMEEDSFILSQNSIFKKGWSFLIIMMIFYSLTFAPYFLAFSEIEAGFNLYFDFAIDILFLIDIVITFFSPYFDNEDNLVMNWYLIAINYLKGWFAFDIISSFPFGVINVISNEYNNDKYTGLKKIMRISRLYRMFKWLKIVRIFKLVKKDNTKGLLSFHNFVHSLELNRVLIFLFFFAILIHVSTCLWIFIAITEESPYNWITYFNLSDSGNFSLYIASFYFHLVSILTIGYGDITCQNTTERVYNLFLLMTGVLMFSFCLSSLSTIFSDIDREITKKEIKLFILEEIKDKYQLDADLYKRIKRSIRNEVKNVKLDKYQFIDSLPPNIRSELILIMHRRIVKKLEFFQEQQHNFIIFVLPLFKPIVLKRDEVVFSVGELLEEIYFVTKGCLSLRIEPSYDHIEIAQIRENEHFGDLLLIYRFPSPYELRARVHSDILVINKKDFLKIQDNFTEEIDFILQYSQRKLSIYETKRAIVLRLIYQGYPTNVIFSIIKRMNLILFEKDFDDYYYNDSEIRDLYEVISTMDDNQFNDFMTRASEGFSNYGCSSNKLKYDHPEISLNQGKFNHPSQNTTGSPVMRKSKIQSNPSADIIKAIDKAINTKKTAHDQNDDDDDDDMRGIPQASKTIFTKLKSGSVSLGKVKDEKAADMQNSCTNKGEKKIQNKVKDIIKKILFVNRWKHKERNGSIAFSEDSIEDGTFHENVPDSSTDTFQIPPKVDLLKRKSSIIPYIRRHTSIKEGLIPHSPADKSQLSKIKEDIENLHKLTKIDKKKSITNLFKKDLDTHDTRHMKKQLEAIKEANDDNNILNGSLEQEKTNLTNSPSLKKDINDPNININLFTSTQNINTNIIILSPSQAEEKSQTILHPTKTGHFPNNTVKIIIKQLKRIDRAYFAIKLLAQKNES